MKINLHSSINTSLEIAEYMFGQREKMDYNYEYGLDDLQS